jgi:hypothetical protein
MVEAIQKIQDHGIWVLSSIINGLESDNVATLRTMRDFAIASGTAFAQFPIYSVYPGTKDYHEMVQDRKNRERPDYVPKHKIQMIREKFWLDFDHTEVTVKHPTMSSAEIEREVRKSWRSFYSLKSIIKRTRSGPLRKLSPIGKLVYTFTCLVFYTLYPDGIAADNDVRRIKLGFFGQLRVKALIAATRKTQDWFGIHPRRASLKPKHEVFGSEAHGPTLGAELN